MFIRMILRSLGLALTLAFAARGADFDAPSGEVEKQVEKNWVDARWQKTEVGQFLSTTISTPGTATYKGIAIKVGENNEATVCFDTDLLRMSAAWTGDFVKISPARYGIGGPLGVGGPLLFTTPTEAGWAKDGNSADPRPRPYGPLPREWAKWRGLYLSGKRVVLHYTVGDVEVRESPWCEIYDGKVIITRTLEIEPAQVPLKLSVCSKDEHYAVTMENVGSGYVLNHETGAKGIEIHAHDKLARLKLFICKEQDFQQPEFQKFVLGGPFSKPDNLAPLMRGGPAHWGEPLVTRGQLGKPNGAFAVDTLTMPYENPWKALLFSGDLDFFPNGDAAVGTVHGDVWRVHGIDEKLEHLTWQRIATGLFQPLGLKIIDGKVYVLGRDQITILEDLNGDGETDHYINFNNDAEVDAGGHGYATCLETDRAGNFYTLRCASGTAHGGSLLRVSADGSKLEVIATGFRNPNGLGVGPDDTVTVADQEGNWVPSTRLDVIHPGGFYGYMPMHHRAETPKIYDSPLCWMPKSADNSAASQVWVPADKWGPLGGQMLHLSYGHGSLLLVVRDPISPQGGVVPLPVRFISGAMRGRFNPHDGNLYVTGLRGWQTAALRDGCFQRVRCLTEKLHLPVAIAAHSNGLRVTFNEPLDRSTAEDPGSYDATRWNYRWAESYGSKDWSVAEPQKEGRDSVTITSAKVSPDGRSVFLSIPDLRPAMQMQLRYNVNTAAGQTVTGAIDHTINQLAPPLETP